MDVMAERYCASCGEYIDTVRAPPGTPPKLAGCCPKCNSAVFRSGEVSGQRVAALQAVQAQADAAIQAETSAAKAKAKEAEAELVRNNQEIQRLQKELDGVKLALSNADPRTKAQIKDDDKAQAKVDAAQARQEQKEEDALEQAAEDKREDAAESKSQEQK